METRVTAAQQNPYMKIFSELFGEISNHAELKLFNGYLIEAMPKLLETDASRPNCIRDQSQLSSNTHQASYSHSVNNLYSTCTSHPAYLYAWHSYLLFK